MINEEYYTNFTKSKKLFDTFVKTPLKKLLKIDIISIEKETLARFKLTNRRFFDAKTGYNSFSPDILEKLKPLENYEFIDEKDFLAAVEERIDQEFVVSNKQILLQLAEVAASEVAQDMDRFASSDLIFRFKNDKDDKDDTEDLCRYTAASRIFPRTHDKLFAENEYEWDPQITIRNSTGGEGKTEIDKLKAQYDKIKDKIPVICPRFLCYARVEVKKNAETGEEEPIKLHDIIVTGTIPVIESLFPVDGKEGINVLGLWEDFEKKKKG